MKPNKIPRRHTAFQAAACVSALAVLLTLAPTARAATPDYDNFDSGALNPAAWATIINPNFPATYTFPTDQFGGHAIRLQGGVPGNCATNDGWSLARAVAACTNHIYTNFYVAADLVGWNPDHNQDTNYQFVGIFARGTGTFDSGTNWSGVALFYWMNVDHTADVASEGALGMGYVKNGYLDFQYPMTQGGVVPASVAYWTLEVGHSYRLVFQGVGRNLTGTVYDTQDLTKPLGTISGDTSLEDIGPPLVLPAPTNGWSGICTMGFRRSGHTCQTITDATFDNYYAAELPPTVAGISAPATPIGMIGAPQVTSHTPASWANFYNAPSGLSFNASTLSTTNNLTTIRLILNGVDVTASATPSPALPATSTTVTYSGLATNTVYDAMVILKDSYNRFTTNVWTFDTFSAAYLASASCKNVECEDYDFGNSGIAFPVPASGYSTNDNTWMIPPGAPSALNYYGGINIANGPASSSYGYVGLPGANDKTDPPGDYYQSTRTAPLMGTVINILTLISGGSFDLNGLIPACEYRTGGAVTEWPNFESNATGDVVGTERGAGYAVSMNNVVARGGAIDLQFAFDTKRQKYADLTAVGLSQFAPPNDPATDFPGTIGGTTAAWWDVEEYNVVQTEGSDWFNYTHDWGTSKSYLVYLRNACAGSQTANLYNGANLTNLLGTFSCTNALQWNWRYTPLRDANGNLTLVTLAGTSTLRLQLAPDKPQWVSVRNGLALNYMALVPIVPGSLTMTLAPAGAITAGAQWQVDGGPLQNSGATVALIPGTHTVTFKPLLHWTTPVSQQVTVTAGGTVTPTGTYVAVPVTLWSTTTLKKSGTVWTQEAGATVDFTNQRVTNAAPTSAKYYQISWDVPTKVAKVSKSGANVVLEYITEQKLPGLNVRAWKGGANVAGGPLDGAQFNLVGPSPAPDDSTPGDSVFWPTGLGTIGYATDSINMPNAGPQEQFTATDGCGVPAPGPFPTGYSENYSVEYRGLLYIATAGSYSFATSSDDGSALWLDAGTDNPTYSQAIVQNNAAQAITTKSTASPLVLAAGYHDIIIRFNQGGGQNALQVQWDPTGGTTWAPIPGSQYFHRALH